VKSSALLSLVFPVIVAATLHTYAQSEADSARYGSYPANYKDIITQWLDKELLHPESARIEWNGDPKPADVGKNGEHVYGYLVNFTVDARNRFGGYTGKQKHAALIRNGEVIKGLGFGY